MKTNPIKKTSKIIAIAIVLLFNMATVCAQKPANSCPRNFDGKAFVQARKEFRKHDGDTIAFDAEVVKIEMGYNAKPYFQAKLDNGEMLWISSMTGNTNLAIGKQVRILGYLEVVGQDDEIGKKYNKGGFQVLAFAMLDTQTKQLNYADVFEKEAMLWKGGWINLPLSK